MPKATSRRTQSAVFPFLELPPEVRATIYRFAIAPKNPIYVYVRRFQSGVNTGLLYANRQISQEAYPIIYANARGVVCNESHLLSRACCSSDFLADPQVSMCAFDENPSEDDIGIYEERRVCKKPWAYRSSAVRSIQPYALARMAEIEISLAWLVPGYCDPLQAISLHQTAYEVSRLLRNLRATLDQVCNQRDKKLIVCFGNHL